MNGDEGKRLFSWQKTIVNIALTNGQKTIHTLLMHWNVIFQTFKHVLKNAIWPCYWNISLQGYKMRKRSFFGRLRWKMIIFAGVRFPKENVSRHINKVRIFGGKWPFRRLENIVFNFLVFVNISSFLLRVIRNTFHVWMYEWQPPK